MELTYLADAYLYLRQSADRSGDELAVSRQRQDGTQLAASRKVRIAETFVDNDVSASGKKRRPAFDQMLKLLVEGSCRTIIAWDYTRLSRNARDTLQLLEIGEKYGVTIMLVRGSDMDLSTPAGRLTASVLASVARHEIEQKSDRQKRASRQAAEAGLPTGGRRPFGYEEDKITIRETEAAALRQAYESVLVGISLPRIAAAINAAGLPTPQKTRDGEVSWWTGQTIRPVLLNPRYAGLRARTVRPDSGRPRWEFVGVAASWPAIVSEETWRAVTQILTDPARTTPPGSGRALLTGIALCGVCGPDAGASVHQGRNVLKQRNYRCAEAMGHIGRQADPVDEFVRDVILERLSREDAVDLLRTDDGPDAAALHREALALEQRLNQVADEFASDDAFTPGQIRVMTLRLKERLETVRQQLADAGRVNVLAPLIFAEDKLATWNSWETDRQRAIVDTLMTVTLHPVGRGTRIFRPETVQVDWKLVV